MAIKQEFVGIVHHIHDTVIIPTANGDFHKRTIVIKEDTNEYVQHYPFETSHADTMVRLDQFKHGDKVKVNFDIIGNLSKKDGVSAFTSLRFWRIELLESQQSEEPFIPEPKSPQEQRVELLNPSGKELPDDEETDLLF